MRVIPGSRLIATGAPLNLADRFLFLGITETMIKLNVPPLYQKIVDVLGDREAYLVGGAVRDLLLGEDIHDLDFALPEQVLPTARRVADRLEGDYYLLDAERGAARVILYPLECKRLIVDFTHFQGVTIEDDLRARDFTITAMGVSIHQPDQLLDPCGGAQDLQQKVIRSCSREALIADPLRAVRGLRMAVKYGFHILPNTQEQMRKVIPRLVEISAERMRDEFFRILEGPHQAAALQIMSQMGMLKVILPGLEENLGLRIRTQRKLEEILGGLGLDFEQEMAVSSALEILVHRLGDYREPLANTLRCQLVPGRDLFQLIFFAALYLPDSGGKDDGKPGLDPPPGSRNSLQLSNQEQQELSASLQAAVQFHLLAGDGSIERREIYRYFRNFSRAGVLGIFLSLAYFLAQHSKTIPRETWPVQLEAARTLLEAWWEYPEERVSPPQLLDGNQLQEVTGLPPGPQIGELLEAIREAQAVGKLTTREEAAVFAQKLVDQGKMEGVDERD